MARFVCLLWLAVAGATLAGAQVRPGQVTRERLVAVVPLIGEGTLDDPRRPLFAPKPGEKTAIEGFSWVASDDGKFAIVEFVAGRNPDPANLVSFGRVWPVGNAFFGFKRGFWRQ